MTARRDWLIEQMRQLLVEKLEVRVPVTEIHARTPLFQGGLGLNSFAVVDLISQLEQRFQFQFREADFREEHFRDLQSLADLLESYHPAGLMALKEATA
ncbi:MAG TPA: acyl carrier protein [Planctomycetaceae bacterium]|jgi:acyl carrier protein|nr:acyl carrier protein [Planctomycetaceae bacterium]